MALPVEGKLQECLYDTLGVERTVNPDALKIAYRKQAMKWHPDKIQQSGASPDAYQEATVRFQQINRAYEVLSDPVERSWYDSHRERILSSSSSSANAAPGEFDLNLWPYFSPSAFSGFGETGNGFYAVYGELFKKVHLQEQVFGRMYGNGDVNDAPELGGRDTPYQNVHAFYRYWQGFSSVKDFGWCDKYDVLQAPNRKVRRLMEEENNKVRKRERREFNNSVRQLASFVKKRDKRVIEKQMELQKIQREKEVQRKARQLQLEKEKQEQIRLYKEQAWTIPSDQEEEDDESDESSDNDVDLHGRNGNGRASKLDKTVEDLECIICGKRFKSIKQLQNHEQSKKHIENVAALKGAFLNDDEQVERLGRQLGIDISSKKSKQNEADVASNEIQEQAGICPKQDTVDNSSPLDSEEGPNTSQSEGGISDLQKTNMSSTVLEKKIGFSSASKMSNQSDEESVDGISQDSPRDQQDKDIPGGRPIRVELEISDVEDDEDSMLASMLTFQQSRQMSAVAPETNAEDANVSNVEGDLTESSPDEEDEDNMLAAMSSLQLNRQTASSSPANSEVRQSDDTADKSVEETGVSSRTEDSVLEEGDFDEDERPRKGKSRRRAKQDKKQAAASNRYVASALDLEQSESGATNGGAISDTGGPSNGANGSVRNVKEVPQAKHTKLAFRGKKFKKEKKCAKQDDHTCQTCGEDFDSRTQLFKHIAVTNHAILKSK